MFVGGYRIDSADGNVFAENPVQFINGLFGILQGLTGIKMGDVKGGMYPRIRPSGTDQPESLPAAAYSKPGSGLPGQSGYPAVSASRGNSCRCMLIL